MGSLECESRGNGAVVMMGFRFLGLAVDGECVGLDYSAGLGKMVRLRGWGLDLGLG